MLGVIVFVAALVESIVEYLFGLPFNHIPGAEQYKWLLAYVSAIVGVGCAIWWSLDLIYLLSLYLGGSIEGVSIVGEILTGTAIGRGANFVHDLFKYFQKPQLPAAQG
jgi:hypothetical protein